MAHPGNIINSYELSDDTDIILRSSNNVDFYVIGALLRHVSPVFKDMFALSTSDDNETKDDLPVVPLAEDSEILRFLLDTIYPYETKPQLSNLAVFLKVSKATQKYNMNMIESKLKRQIANSQQTEPLSVFAIAINLGWEDVAIDAARRTLITPLQKLAYVTELQGITGASLYRFLEYRHQCENSKEPMNEVLPPPRRHKESNEARTNSESESDTPHCDQNGNPPFASASEPYTRSDWSDLILRTSDDVDFHVVAALLRLSSTYFNRILPLESPVTTIDGLAVIAIGEDSSVLYHLLSFIYPTQEPGIQSPESYAQLVAATRKYEMANIEDRIRKHATASSLVNTQPLSIYAIASALGWEDLAKMAALNTLHTPLQKLSYVDEMHLMTGAHLFRLVRFRFDCASAACDALKAAPFDRYGYGQWSRYYHRGQNKQELDAKLPDVLYERLKSCPRGSTVTDVYVEGLSSGIANAKDDGRFDIWGGSFFKILQCTQDTQKVVEEAVSKVDFLT